MLKPRTFIFHFSILISFFSIAPFFNTEIQLFEKEEKKEEEEGAEEEEGNHTGNGGCRREEKICKRCSLFTKLLS